MKKLICFIVTILSVSGYMIAQNTSIVASHTFVVDGLQKTLMIGDSNLYIKGK